MFNIHTQGEVHNRQPDPSCITAEGVARGLCTQGCATSRVSHHQARSGRWIVGIIHHHSYAVTCRIHATTQTEQPQGENQPVRSPA